MFSVFCWSGNDRHIINKFYLRVIHIQGPKVEFIFVYV